jgi:hypothetical protein
MCIALYGRQWLMTAAPIAGALLICALPGLGIFIANNGTARRIAILLTPWLIYVLAGLKLTLGAWVLHACRRRELLSRRNVATLLMLWAALVALALATLIWLLPPEMRPSLPKLICVAMLIPPGVRCILALPALHANRHR